MQPNTTTLLNTAIKHGLSKADVAREINVCNQTVSNWEQGTTPRRRTYLRLKTLITSLNKNTTSTTEGLTALLTDARKSIPVNGLKEVESSSERVSRVNKTTTDTHRDYIDGYSTGFAEGFTRGHRQGSNIAT
jgi:transcriptional regulator with XRE-family HTH domain